MELKIEHGIPVPPHSPNGLTAYLRAMGVGDSYLLPAGASRGTLSSSCSKVKDKKFLTRTVTEKGINRLRVWRIS